MGKEMKKLTKSPTHDFSFIQSLSIGNFYSGNAWQIGLKLQIK